MKLEHSSQHEQGQSMVMIALFIVALLAFLGLLIDGGRAYAARRQSQNAADAAAFAAVRYLTTHGRTAADDNAIRDNINTFAVRNGVSQATVGADVTAVYLYPDNRPGPAVGRTLPIAANVTGVEVTATVRFQPFLITVLSAMGPVSTRATAGAQSGAPDTMDNLMPLTLKDQDFQKDTDYQLFGDKTGPGAFQWLSFDCASSNVDLVEYLTQSKPSGSVSVGDYVCNGPGVQNSNNVKDALNAWLAKLTAENRYWTIPIYDTTRGTGSNLQYHIVKFAIFEFDGYNFQGSDKYVMGKFVKGGKLGPITTPGTCNQTWDDPCGISLWR